MTYQQLFAIGLIIGVTVGAILKSIKTHDKLLTQELKEINKRQEFYHKSTANRLLELELKAKELAEQEMDIRRKLDTIGARVLLLEQELKAKNIRGMRKKNKAKY